MTTGKQIDPSVKTEIIEQIKHNGMRVVDASEHYSVSTKSIYRWLREGVVDNEKNLVLELRRVRKENEQLYRLLGRATAELQRPKK